MNDTAFAFDTIATEDAAPVVSQVFKVAPENVTPIWDQVEPLVLRALHGHPTHEPEDVRRMILGGGAQLWVQWSGRVDAVAVTEFVSYPRGAWVRVWLVAARQDAKLDDEAFLASLNMWCDMHGCRGLEATGRMGWLRRFPNMKFVGAMMRSVR